MASQEKDVTRPPEQEPEEERDAGALPRWMGKIKKLRLGEARDDLLVIAAVFYGVGYMVWALHASRYNLGLLPALESQYFIAGGVPTLAVIAVYKLTVLFERLLDTIRQSLGPDVTGWKKWVRVSILSLFWGSLLVAILSGYLEKPFPQLSKSISVYAIYVFVISFFVLPGGESGLARGYRLFMVRYLAFSFAALGIIFYATRVHSVLPQEIGGGRPRCATLDLAKSQLSSQTRAALFSEDASRIDPKLDNEPTRSLDVDVFFVAGDYLLVKPRGRTDLDRTTYEIRRADVRAITWCQ